jgi:DNA-binding MarR family transcriptional regulator
MSKPNTVLPTNIKEEHIEVVNDLLHQMLFGLRLDRPGTWSRELDSILPVDLHTLKLVSERPNIILKEIRDELKVPHSTLTSIINRLEKHGVLRRVISSRDRRSYGLELTPKGEQLQEEHDRVDRMIATELLGTLDNESERETLIKLLSKVGQRLS